MHMTFTVAVAGASGYAGGEVLRLLLDHPDATIGTLTAHSSAGTPLGLHHPHLVDLADRVLQPTTPQALAGHDVVVLALPHGASGQVAAELEALGEDPVVLDLGADHRLVDAADWSAYYGSEHAGTWTYGLPELIDAATASRGRDRLAGARRIAVPGCNVTAVTLGLQPGVAAGLLDTSDLVAVLAVGYSGAGKALKAHLLASEAVGAAVPYAVGGSHRHIPELAQNLRAAGADDVRTSFTPVLVPMSRGILATATARLAPGVTTDDDALREVWRAAYADEPFVHVLPAGQWPTTASTAGANTAHVQVAYDARAGRVVTVTAIDNLVKGTAGGAVQSLNLALGLPETLGLPRNGVAP
ncbi:N-acetyl-gamma-glutamyl-phosphate reductase [Cellulomonas wangsupingiae]|uniref:N-acetyl-gamma-glutamyl-phosphate reductase n=1 Tax=Cellulomonas wangsupingiae TaxID=2968085 RepID=A0ABY5KB86_9CELL|nr:N-acetyl-gamma-glutamyl-phosphate reductase [Cellulomonas wangsupingiae]MCC2335150.1 N-acetyl-gamma-glutamyl-phosphate reductase [Cellulomonas wangsupingiae]MCM0639231.1 N-acetyl-gamma-glutamyl-phosphate reductase [Cellulomonas wangsupingiae]UUI66701.1 N-acetyl-gamma-glutamyl-phosphate reductase [Cellulomonas wangsupingiae]